MTASLAFAGMAPLREAERRGVCKALRRARAARMWERRAAADLAAALASTHWLDQTLCCLLAADRAAAMVRMHAAIRDGDARAATAAMRNARRLARAMGDGT